MIRIKFDDSCCFPAIDPLCQDPVPAGPSLSDESLAAFSVVSRFAQPLFAGRRWVAALLLAHVLAMSALAASPRLHHWVHPDADDDDHACAVMLFLHGGVDSVPGLVLAAACLRDPGTVFVASVEPEAFVPSSSTGRRPWLPGFSSCFLGGRSGCFVSPSPATLYVSLWRTHPSFILGVVRQPRPFSLVLSLAAPPPRPLFRFQ